MSQDCLAGGCQCGAVRYELKAPPLDVYICHCTECRRQSSSAFGISVITTIESLQLIKGEPKSWSRPTSNGDWLDCFFCPTCGSRLWHQTRDAGVALSIKGGSLDQSVDVSDVTHIWTRSRLPGILIPEHVREFPKAPD